MACIKLENISFSQPNKTIDTSILIESIRKKKYINILLQTTNNSNEIYNSIYELYQLTNKNNLSSFLNYLKEKFDELTSNQKLDILNFLYRKLDKNVVEIFFKEINLHKIVTIEWIINRDRKWDKIYEYIKPEHKQYKLDIDNNSHLSNLLKWIINYEWKNRPHQDNELVENLKKYFNTTVLKEFVRKFSYNSLNIDDQMFYNINRMFLELVDKTDNLIHLLGTQFHSLSEFWTRLKLLEKVLESDLDIKKYSYLQPTIEKVYNSTEKNQFKEELIEKYENYMLKQ